MYSKFLKRFYDVFFSILGLIFLSPIFVVVAIAIKCDSKGPVVFKQKRVGRNNKVFTFYKFRSMTVDAPKETATRNINSKAYITKVGRVLRKTSIDELPQLFNIIKGEMSFIGPRPVVLGETDLIKERVRLGVYSVRPGLTGWAQVNGRDTVVDMIAKAALDAEYAAKVSLFRDLKIFFLTVKQVLFGDGVVEGAVVYKETKEERRVSVLAQSERMKEQAEGVRALAAADVLTETKEGQVAEETTHISRVEAVKEKLKEKSEANSEQPIGRSAG